MDNAPQGLERIGDDELHADSGGQVQTAVALDHQPVDQSRICDRPVDQFGRSIGGQMLDVLEPPRTEVVDDNDPSPLATSASAICEPMNPAPPVITYCKLSGSFYAHGAIPRPYDRSGPERTRRTDHARRRLRRRS